MIGFEFDDDKSKTNLEKHGIDFRAAQELWKDPDLMEIQAKSDDEDRFLVIGLIGAKHWSAVVTHRNERIRVDLHLKLTQDLHLKLTHPGCRIMA